MFGFWLLLHPNLQSENDIDIEKLARQEKSALLVFF